MSPFPALRNRLQHTNNYSVILNHFSVHKRVSWTSEVNFKSECLAGSQDIKGYFFSLEKHYLLSQFQLHLTGTILINKLIIQFTKTLNFSPLLSGIEICELRGRSQLSPTASHAVSLLTEVHKTTLG